MSFFVGAVVGLLLHGFSSHFEHNIIVNAFPSVIGGRTFDYVSEGLIFVGLYVEIFVICVP